MSDLSALLSIVQGLPLPFHIFLVSVVIYLVGRPAVALVHKSFFEGSKAVPVASRIDQAEKGTLRKQEQLSGDELFQLEKRAFFSKTWLFVCHRSKFEKAGDYHTFDFAGISFFVVLGKDERLRAFHNVCRHRAYTIVRKSCGTSTRFSCKYHGWQYDDAGKLVKAPKFENSPGFNPKENGLFEVKLISTKEGLIFVNFDASTMNLPFNNVKSNLDMGACTWLDCVRVTAATNWKQISKEFASQAQWSRTPFSWFSSRRKHNIVRLLGPLSMAKELDEDTWCTMTLLPTSMNQSVISCDIFAKEGRTVAKTKLEKWRWMLEKEMEIMSKTEDGVQPGFAYECGGRTIDLNAILARHQRSEAISQRKLQPAVRITGFSDIDQEAAALCDAVDGVVEVDDLSPCTKVSSWGRRLDW